jgi:hypothetical protein
MPTYADYVGWVISTIAGRFEVTADNWSGGRGFEGKVRAVASAKLS